MRKIVSIILACVFISSLCLVSFAHEIISGFPVRWSNSYDQFYKHKVVYLATNGDSLEATWKSNLSMTLTNWSYNSNNYVSAFSLFDNIGNILSTSKIANTMTSMGRKIDQKTVEKYLKGLLDSLMIY